MRNRLCVSRFFVCIVMVMGLLRFNAPVHADTRIGDWGHFLVNSPKVFLNNPEGKAFDVTLGAMRWAVPEWNRTEMRVRVSGPDGKVIVTGVQKIDGNEVKLAIPAGAKGVYVFEPNVSDDGKIVNPPVACWVGSTLDQAVVWTGDSKGHAIEGRRLVTHTSVPRRWWFFVPRGVTTFTVKAQRADRYMSQRERWGYFVMSPRGQRVASMWGQPLPPGPGEEYRAEMEVKVLVEPGTGGRFWCLESRYGDAHNYSKPNIALEGVPPYVARSPEEWFDPSTGKNADVVMYDDEPFMQYAPDGKVAQRWPGLQHFTPVCSLGDPDGSEVRGDAEFAMWNPEGKDLRFRIGTYLPRKGPSDPAKAQVKFTDASGKVALDAAMPLFHLHEPGKNTPEPLPAMAKGVTTVSVSGAERWFAFTYPATPLVLKGKPAGDGFSEFHLEFGVARNWYFLVPRGTKEFTLRAKAQHETDVMELQINAPDRTVAMFYENAGEKTVKVPPGMDGKIWHVRIDVGSATQMITEPGNATRYLGIYTTIGLKGVPGLLSPTWEQWFDPANPGKR